MVKKSIAVGMDIGTTHVRVIIGELNTDGTVNMIGVGTSPSRGLKKGVIVDLDETVSAIREAVEEAERMAGLEVDSVFLGIVGSQVGIINNRGVVAVSGDDKEITEEDVERVMQAARVIALPPEREIIDVLPREFIVDGYDGIRDPVGMIGVRLEVDAMVVSGTSSSIRNTLRCVNRAGLEVHGLVLNSLANAEIVLSRDEKELGVFLVDIGGGTAEVSVFQGGSLKDITVIPVGGGYITNDLAVGLKTTLEQAERLKIQYGVASLNLASTEDNIKIQNVAGKGDRTISQADLATVIEPRILEILQLVKEEAAKMGFQEPLPAGVVLTGGVSLMKGTAELTEEVFNCSVRAAQPGYIGVKSPIYSTAVGIIHYVQRSHMVTAPKSNPTKAVKGLWGRIRHWFMDFFE
jgi:cell division protein FtsA